MMAAGSGAIPSYNESSIFFVGDPISHKRTVLSAEAAVFVRH